MQSSSMLKVAFAAAALFVAQVAFAADAPPASDPWYIVPGIGTLLTWFSLFR